MGWETIESGGHGAFGKYGKQWCEVPAIAVNKGGISVNRAGMEAFDFKVGNYYFILFDSQNRRIGLKAAIDDEIDGAFRMQMSGGKNDRTKVGSIKCYKLCQRIIDCAGKAFRMHLNSGERVIEISLDPRNALKRR